MDTLKAILPLVMFCFALALIFAVFRSISIVVVSRGVRRECSTCDLRRVCDEESPEECGL